MARVRVAGRWLHSFTVVDGLKWRHAADGGCVEASWGISQRPSALAHPVLTRGALVEVFDGLVRVWVGQLSESGEASSECHAVGLLNSTRRLLSPTSDLNASINAAITNGAKFTYVNNSAPPAIPTETPEYLYDAITAAATGAGKRATVRADGVLRFETDPTTPDYYVVPGVGILGRADEDYVTHVSVLYISSVSGTPPVADGTAVATAADTDAAAVYGRSDHFIDIRDRGLLTATEAGWIASGFLAKAGARLSFANSITVTADQFRSIGGQRTSLAQVRAGQMVRFMGVRTPERVARASFDVVIGATDYEDGSGQITLSPLGLAARNLSDIIATIPTIWTRLNPNPGAGATAA